MLTTRNRTAHGFTLIELIVVIVILGILAALAVPTFSSTTDKTVDGTLRTTLESVGNESTALAAIDRTAPGHRINDSLADLELPANVSAVPNPHTGILDLSSRKRCQRLTMPTDLAPTVIRKVTDCLAPANSVLTYGTSYLDRVLAVATGPDGSMYLAGAFAGTLTLGAHTVTSSGNVDAFVAKRNLDGSWAWLAQAGSPETNSAMEYVNKINVGADGSAVVSGSAYYNAAFPGASPNTMSAGTGTNGFVAKIRPTGAWQWAYQLGTNGPDMLHAHVTGDGTIYLAGQVGLTGSGSFAVGPHAHTLGPGMRIFLTTMRQDGTFGPRLISSSGGTAHVYLDELTVTSRGDVVLALSQMSGGATYGSITVPSTSPNGVIVSVSADLGRVMWAKGTQTSSNSELRDVVALPDGSVVVCGATLSTITWDSITLTNTAFYSAVYVRLDRQGTAVWGTVVTGTGASRCNDLEPGPDGSLVAPMEIHSGANIGGRTVTTAGSEDCGLALVDPATGLFRDYQQYGGSSQDVCAAAVLIGGNVVTVGSSKSSTLVVGGTSYPGTNDMATFVPLRRNFRF